MIYQRWMIHPGQTKMESMIRKTQTMMVSTLEIHLEEMMG
ncbi:hypothetical protein C943_03066 [Mariniradius saccharolyticus AK6]|uniref:Uncharacterized protein n=1 Tax=Mariniradius saccharolyticus AK6 TaxID=1239962 RepID=M7Y0Z9_9BACT|nr:hypothetical protein C943_03066 [Mariniradius saccharolyticus AK6]